MDLVQALLLALIQGLTEFLPISSSAHLILPFEVLGWPDQGLAFDTAVHLGSLVAVLWYFRVDVWRLLTAFFVFLREGKHTEESRFAVNLLIASLPVIVAGLILKDQIETNLRGVTVIAVTTIGFGILLYIGDRSGRRDRLEHSLTWRQALMIGVAQCFALIPGTSRSGVTMTVALLAGFTREAASRISFLLSIPAIGGAATLKTIDLATGDAPVDWAGLSVGLIVSAISAYLCIRLFLGFISRIGFLPFVIYRLVLGSLLFLLVV
ncbi:MAG: undecaprenyl-diphosphate phosphatase [Pseudomonadota bacterium]